MILVITIQQRENYNALKGQVYTLKSEHMLPNNMYDAVNNMQQNLG